MDIPPISDEAHEFFANSSRQYARKRRVIGLIAVLAGLTFTYGILIYFIFATVIQSL